jgi:conjugal transfer pilus assembly protein TraB
MKIKLLFSIISLLVVSKSYSQNNKDENYQIPNGTVKKFSGNDMTPYENNSQFQKKYSSEQERRAEVERELQELKNKLGTENNQEVKKESKQEVNVANNDKKEQTNNSMPTTVSNNEVSPQNEIINSLKKNFQIKSKSKKSHAKNVSLPSPRYKEPLIFTVSSKAIDSYNTTVLPTGSYVKTRVLTGVEANDKEAYPMLLQADYAFVGPNRSKIDMTGCFFIAKAKGNLSIERVLGEITELSCVRSNGEHFKRTVKGFIAGEDSTFGIAGELISKQGQVLTAAIIANLAKGAGEAIALKQQEQQIAVGNAGAAATATNVTGSTGAFVAGRAVADASTIIAQWYLNYATSLIPSIAVGSGRDVWIVMLDNTNVPSLDENDQS